LIVTFLASLLSALPFCASQESGEAQWIWGSWSDGASRPQGERCLLKGSLELPAAPKSAMWRLCADNHARVWVNGKLVGRSESWTHASRVRPESALRAGSNEILIEGWNDGGPAAVLLFGSVECEGGAVIPVRTSSHFLSASGRLEERGALPPNLTWTAARELGRLGEGPWTGVTLELESQFEPAPGLAIKPLVEEAGSLVALAIAPDGSLTVSVEYGAILQFPDRDRDGTPEEAEVLSEKVHGCHGLCWLGRDLYAVGSGPQGMGLYRFPQGTDAPQCLGTFPGDGGEHGPHGVTAGPDGRLYVAVGNHSQPPLAAWSPRAPFRHHYEGHILPRYVDPLGHAVDCKSPGGTIVSIDSEGKDWRVVAGGFRNQYDLAFDRDGRCYTYDSDMEWDLGLPWYRPTRFLEILPGGEYGWRTGSTVWPDWYEDSLPSLADAGRGSPTGVVVYEAERLPHKYRGAILGGDWSQGRILALRRSPLGEFLDEPEPLVTGRPLNVTDLVVDGSGRVIFSTGGRGTRGGIYALDLAPGLAPEPPQPRRATPPRWPLLSEEPAISMEAAARGLGSPSREERFLAATAWSRRSREDRDLAAAKLTNPLARAEALLASQRAPEEPTERVRAEGRLREAITLARTESGPARTAALRAAELQLGKLVNRGLDPQAREAISSDVLTLLPGADARAARQLFLILAHLKAPAALEPMLATMESAPSRAEQIHAAYCARLLAADATADQRARFVTWLRAAYAWSGGDSFHGYIENIATDVRSRIPEKERSALDRVLKEAQAPPPPALAAAAPLRDAGAVWEFLERTRSAPRRSAAEGALVFREACSRCHKFGSEGRTIGPDLTSVAARFTRRDLFDAVVDPSRTVSDQYQSWSIQTRDGRGLSGMIIQEDSEKLTLLDGAGEKTTLPAGEVAERTRSTASLMPAGLLDALTLEQAGDLFALLLAPTPVDPPSSSEWRRQADGALEGWRGALALWRVERGALLGTGRQLPTNEFLVSEAEYGDFVLEADVRLLSGNSGLQFRSKRLEDGRVVGYQADLGQEYWGSLYEEGGRGMISQPAREIWTSAVDKTGWNHLVVEARGDALRIELNGLRTAEIRDGKASRGIFAFQLHGGMNTELAVRNLRIRDLRTANR